VTVTELMVELQRLAQAGEGGRRVVISDGEYSSSGWGNVTGAKVVDSEFGPFAVEIEFLSD